MRRYPCVQQMMGGDPLFPRDDFPGPPRVGHEPRRDRPDASTEQQERLAFLETAVSQINDIVLITEAGEISDPGPRIVYVNDAFTKLTGYARHEVIGKTPRLLQRATTQRAERARIRAALSAEQPVRAELLNYAKDGREYWLETEIVPMRDASGRTTHFVSVGRDVSLRKASEMALAVSEQRFRTVAQLSNSVVWEWNIADDTLWRNDRGTGRFGFGGTDPLSYARLWEARLHPDDRDRVLAGLHEVLQGAAPQWQAEYRVLRKDKSWAQVVSAGEVTRSEAGGAVSMVGSTLDVTEQRLMTEKLRQSQKMEAVGQLTGGVAHDFNNILTVILANSDALLETEGLDPEFADRLEEISAAVLRAADMTRSLLAFSRKQPLSPKPTNVNDLVAGTSKLLHRALGEHIGLRTVLANDPWSVHIDRAQLESALVNLCVNARDAMAGGGTLLIETNNVAVDSRGAATLDVPAGDYVVLRVTDTGCGMPPDIVAKIFEPFFTTKEVGKGTGLGLAMVYGFVTQSLGHIKVSSTMGQGTSFSLYLPRRDGEAEEKRADDQQPGPRGHETILVVEDDSLIRVNMATQLRGLGYGVAAAENGEAALDALEKTPHVDLVLTDVVMPGRINGTLLAEEVARRWPGTQVAFMSGYTDSIVGAGAMMLNKPFRRSELARFVRQALDAPRPLRA